MKDKSFIGDRLKSARLYRGYTIRSLADELNVKYQSVSQYENNNAKPSPETLLSLEKVLRFPRDYYFNDNESIVKEGTTYFRALLTSTKKNLAMQEERVKIIATLYKFLEQYIDFPVMNLPEGFDGLSPDEAAEKLRDYWGLGSRPIENMIYLLEREGFIVNSTRMPGQKIDAYGKYIEFNNEGRYFIVVGDDKHSATRRQFDAAHELGHIVLHDRFDNINELEKSEFRNIENEAHSFAAAFLLPKDAFLDDLIYPTNIEYYIELKKKWKTSISAMIVRAHKLGAISYNQYQYMMKKMAKSGMKTNEPLDDKLFIEKPAILKQAVEVLLESSVFNGTSFISELSKFGLSIRREEVEEILDLPEGTLAPIRKIDNIINLKDHINSNIESGSI